MVCNIHWVMEFLDVVSKIDTIFKRKFLYFVHRNNDEPAKIEYFQFLESIFVVKSQLNLLENEFLI